MTEKEKYPAIVLENLCYKDKRHPQFQFLYGEDENEVIPRKNCSCDNCFKGKDKLALNMINLIDLHNIELRMTWEAAQQTILVGDLSDERCHKYDSFDEWREQTAT